MSAAVLLLQLVQTRVFSVMLWHHLTYLVVTFTLLGFAAGGAVLAGVIATLAFALAPAWASTHAGGELTTPTADAGVSGAQDWVLANVPTDATLIVEDSMWLDLVLAGYERDNVVWFFKVDLDPGVQIDPVQVDYVVLHDYVADGARPVLASTLQLAEPVASFGEGVGRMTVWEVNGS